MNKNIFSLLQKRFPSGEYALMEEVRDRAGFSASRSADYVAMSLWPSRGLALTGIELKSWRGDWLSERKNPAKAENIFQYCDYWWLLTSEEGIAKLEEIPETWGWMTVKKDRIKIIKDAPKLTPVVLSRHFLASMLKRANDKSGYTRTEEIESRIEEARANGVAQGERELEQMKKNYEELRKEVRDFYTASGIDLKNSWWSDAAKKKGEAVNFLVNGGIQSSTEDLLKLEDTAQKVLQQISNALKTFKELQPQEKQVA